MPVRPGDSKDVFATPEKIRWIRKTIRVRPQKSWDIWDELHKAVRKGAKFPITLDQAVEVMRIIDTVRKQNPRFA